MLKIRYFLSMKVLLTYIFGILLFCSISHAQTANNEISIAGIKEKVAIRRDARWIPYIDAKNDADVYFAQGYVTASDRLWQMDLMRRVARGEMSEVFGRSQLEEDKRWRRFNFARVADESLALLSPDLRNALEAYSAGVNAYIASLEDASIPIEFKILQYRPREWRPADSIVIGKVLSDALSTTWRNDLLRASILQFPTEKITDLNNKVTPYDVVLFGSDARTAAGKAVIKTTKVSDELLAQAERDEKLRQNSLEMLGLYAEDLAASNNWVISGKNTADGKPILANDPHLAPTAPGIWYLTHLSSPTLRVSGVAIPGVPGIILGHNESIAWGATNVGPDVQDLYYETFNEKGEYKTPTGWAPSTVRKEVIKVRSNPLKTDTENVDFEIIETAHGPIIAQDGGKQYALKWTALDPKNTEFEAFYLWNRSKNWEEFKNGLRKYGGAAQNFIYADVKGNIGWYAASKIPIRRVGDGSLPYDGSTTDGDWVGTIPFEELPNLYNPPGGLIVTANQRIAGTSYKYPQMTHSVTSWRARTIFDALNGRKNLTMDDSRDVQLSVLNIQLSNFAKDVVKMNGASAATLEVLKGWDGKMTADSRSGLLANEIMNCVANKVADANKPVPAGLIRERILYWAVPQQAARWLPAGFKSYAELTTSCDSIVRTQLADPKRFGPDESTWTWGRAFQSRLPHPLAVAPLIGAQFATPTIALNGSGQSPNVGSAVSMRHITSPGNWDVTRHVIPLGESGDPKSSHYKDQFDAWRTGVPAIFPFSKQAVVAAAMSTITLMPKSN
jgi:penicillin amidase